MKLKDNSDKVKAELPKGLERGLEAVGLTAEAYAKKVLTAEVYTGNKPWKLTGVLRNSIGHKPDGKLNMYIGTNVKYARGIETGTHRKAGAVHFLKKAATEHTAEYKELIEDSMKNA